MKVLIIRLSSIGDIVLTTPVIRSLVNHSPTIEIHYLVKAKFKETLQYHPAITKLHIFDGNLAETIRQLKAEKFDFILDLHSNLRSFLIRTALQIPSAIFQKNNWTKWLMTTFKQKLFVPHVTERYLKTLESIQVPPASSGLEFFCATGDEEWARSLLFKTFGSKPYVVWVLGATKKTKQWLPEYFFALARLNHYSVVLLGGAAETELATQLEPIFSTPVLNLVGKISLSQSAAILKQAALVLTHDTGLMHIAAAFQKPMITLWGNTVPEFGMYPYQTPYLALQVMGLSCRPCSRIGYDACPKGHFRCMEELTPEYVWSQIQSEWVKIIKPSTES